MCFFSTWGLAPTPPENSTRNAAHGLPIVIQFPWFLSNFLLPLYYQRKRLKTIDVGATNAQILCIFAGLALCSTPFFMP